MLMIASVSAAIAGTNFSKAAGSGVGLPSELRACRCRMAAPARAASIACSAIWPGVTGRYSDMDGVWTAPVTAQVMMTLRRPAAGLPSPPTKSKMFDMFSDAEGLTGDVPRQVGTSEPDAGRRVHGYPATRDIAQGEIAHDPEADAFGARIAADARVHACPLSI